MSIQETTHQHSCDCQCRDEKSCGVRMLACGCLCGPASSHLFFRVSLANHTCTLLQKVFPYQHSYSQRTNKVLFSYAVVTDNPDSPLLTTTTAYFSFKLNPWSAEALIHGIFFLGSRMKKRPLPGTCSHDRGKIRRVEPHTETGYLPLWFVVVVHCCLAAKSYLTLCNLMNCNTPSFPVLHYLLEFAQIHVNWVTDAIQPSHPLPPTSPPALSLSQHQGLFQWVRSSHQVAKVLELQLQHHSCEYTGFISFRIVWFDLLASKGLSRVLSSTTVQEHQIFSMTIWTFVGKMVSLLFKYCV